MLLVLVQFFFYFSFCVVLEKAVKHWKSNWQGQCLLETYFRNDVAPTCACLKDQAVNFLDPYCNDGNINT